MLQVKDNNKYYVFCIDAVTGKSEKALKILVDAHWEGWLPKSQLLGWGDGHGNNFIALPYWLASNNGLLNKNWNGSDAHPYTIYIGSDLKSYLKKYGLNI